MSYTVIKSYRGDSENLHESGRATSPQCIEKQKGQDTVCTSLSKKSRKFKKLYSTVLYIEKNTKSLQRGMGTKLEKFCHCFRMKLAF